MLAKKRLKKEEFAFLSKHCHNVSYRIEKYALNGGNYLRAKCVYFVGDNAAQIMLEDECVSQTTEIEIFL